MWNSEKSDTEKSFKMRRAMAQDIGRSIKNKELTVIFSDEKLGPSYRMWGYKILMNFKADPDIQGELLAALIMSYDLKIDINKDKLWHGLYLMHMPSITKKIEGMSDITIMGFMDKTDAPDELTSESGDEYG